jgi:CheY-like chemotaxis protein
MPAAPALAESAPARYSGVVLLVEDNPINQLVASEMLELLGVEVVCAADGVEGLEAFAARRFDLVLMDIQMPNMDGLEAAREIRRRERLGSLAETPIVALTANSSEEDRRRSLDAGMNDFLSKPVKTEQIAAVLARYLGTEPS